MFEITVEEFLGYIVIYSVCGSIATILAFIIAWKKGLFSD